MAFSTHDIVSDSPTNNFATFNPLVGNGSPSDGNLKFVSQNVHSAVGTTMFVHSSSGKWYIEYYGTGWDNHPFIVFYTPEASSADIYTNTSTTNVWHWRGSGDWGTTGMASTSTGLPTWSSGDIVGVLIDYDNDGIFGFVNGSAVNSGNKLFSPSILDKKFGITIKAYNGTHYMNFGQDPTFAGNKNTPATVNGVTGPFAPSGTAAGTAGLFYYPPPAGAKALCTANLPDFTPTVTGDVPQDYFKTVLYDGTGGTQSITGVGFQPDLVWIKMRDTYDGTNSYSHYLYDSVRGINRALQSNSINQEETNRTGLTNFNQNGFSLGTQAGENRSGNSFVSWCWKAGGAAVTNNDGSITSTVSANTDAGFSIVSWTGTGSVATVGHGLSSAPDMVIVKGRSYAQNWVVYHSELGATKWLQLNSSTAALTETAIWNNTAPTSSAFTVGTSAALNPSGGTNITYCWHSVEGYSKFGSYSGSYSDFPYIYTGFKPAFVMIKSSSSDISGYGSWIIYDNARDPYNQMNKVLYANKSVGEGYRGNGTSTFSGLYLDFVSNGFKIRVAAGETNDSSEPTYIYAAFAEQPFKFSNAR